MFAAGNASNCGLPEPPGLSSVTSPASLGSAFAVGSTGNHGGAYATHSAWGPSLEASAGLPTYPDPRGWPTMKPQVVAPGVDVVSAIDESSGYATLTGTSMSAPHITGLVALMLEAGECLRGDYATLGGLVTETARPIDYASGGEPAPGIGNVPNYATGWGEIDAHRAVDAAAHACGPQGFLRGTVTAADGTPIGAARVEVFVDESVRVYEMRTDTAGRYVRRLPVIAGGGYHVRVSAYGYLTSNESGVLVQADATTRVDVALAVAPRYKIGGRVTDAATGWPLHAKLSISDYPDGPVWSDPVTGAYSVRLPEGRAYRIDVASDIGGYAAATRVLASVSGGGTQDFTLAADPIACSAPGYTYATTVLSEDFESNGNAPPAGWSVTSAGLGWLFGDSASLSGSVFAIPAHGRFAASNDELGAGDGWDNDGRVDMLRTPPENLASQVDPVLRFRSFFIDTGSRARVEASTDGGATWSAIGTPHLTTAVEGWTDEAVPLSGVAAAATRIRFHFDDGTTDEFGVLGGGWAVDDVSIRGGCRAPVGGGLVFGHVRDANTGAALGGATVESPSGAVVSASRSDDAAVGDGFYALYAPSGAPSLTARRGNQPEGYGDATLAPTVATGATTLAEFALPAGRLRLAPTGPSAVVELGTTANATFSVSNTGTRPLHFALERAVVEEHFDAPTFPPDGWNIANAGQGCAWIALDPLRFANTAGGDGSAAMVYPFNCFGGDPSDTSLVSPSLDLSGSRSASVGFFLSMVEGPDSFPRFDVDASTDGGAKWATLHTETHDDNGDGPGALIELDLSAFVGAEDVRVRFRYRSTPPWGSIIIDQIHLFDSVSASPMLDVAPQDGTLAIGESRSLQATFDARTVAQPGVYELPIRVAEDTPYAWPFGDVVATMTVTPPASYGALAGTVRGLGACDADPHPLAGARVTIEAGGQASTTTTDAEGHYVYWVDAARGPFTVTVEADDHLGVTHAFDVNAGTQTPADADLRVLHACLLTDPPAPLVSVASGQSRTLAIDLLNAGAAGTA